MTTFGFSLALFRYFRRPLSLGCKSPVTGHDRDVQARSLRVCPKSPHYQQYKRELHAGDTVTIQSALLEVREQSICMLHKMLHDASTKIAAATVVVGV